MTFDASAHTVLIADDATPIRLLVRVNLEAEGYTVIEAANGQEALDRVRADTPDILLLDIMMPIKDGWEVAAELFNDDSAPQIPIIFLTARADLRDHERGLEAGALNYITKPFNPRELAERIEECISASSDGESDSFRDERLQLVRDMQQTPE